MTGRTFFIMLVFAGTIGTVMWFFILPMTSSPRCAAPTVPAIVAMSM